MEKGMAELDMSLRRWLRFETCVPSPFVAWKGPDTSKARKMRRERARELTRIRERQLEETRAAR